MTSLLTNHAIVDIPNPIDEAEQLAGINEWTFERHQDELTILMEGDYADMQMRLYWREAYRTLQIANIIDLKIPEAKQDDIYRVVGMINERMWIGHFEYWPQEKSVLFRHASLANDPMSSGFSEEHLAMLIETAVGECERFYPVFQFILWGGMNAEDAIDAAMLDCQGSA